jgi:hypothetical protein
MHITGLHVKNYLAIHEVRVDLPPGGVQFAGRNRAGKTSHLKAIIAGLTGRGIEEKAIRTGADSALIEIDLDDLTVRRALARGGKPSVKITSRTGEKAPTATMLKSLFGALLDPSELWRADKKTRRALVLDALQDCTVTLEQLRKWVPALPETFSVAGNGFEAVERLQKVVYERRTRANSLRDTARTEADRTRHEASTAVAAAPAKALTIEEAETVGAKAHAALGALEARARDAKGAADRCAGTTARVGGLRKEAVALRAAIASVEPDTMDAIKARIDAGRDKVLVLEQELETARATLAVDEDALAEFSAAQRKADANAVRANDLEREAANLEATLRESGIAPVAEEDLAAARGAVDTAKAGRKAAVDAANIARLKDIATRAEADAQAKDAEAARLHAIYKRITEEAPKELLAASGGIAGLTFEDEDICLDGHRFEDLAETERMYLSVEIARRLSKCGVIVIDEIQRLDPDEEKRFLAQATRNGLQVIATRAQRGELTIEAISAETAEEAKA